MSSQRIAPELARYIEDYIAETNLNQALGTSLDADSNLIVFCREVFGQFFANVAGEAIHGFGPSSAQRANVLLRRHRSDWSPPQKRLLRRFQHFCKLYPDLLGDAYSGGLDGVSDFHFDFIPTMLGDIHEWAQAENEAALQEAISRVATLYAEFEGTLESPEE